MAVKIKDGYYSGFKLLSLLDLDRERPELFFCTSNKTAGKTTFFNAYVLDKFISSGEKFLLLYRYSYEIKNVVDKFFRDISKIEDFNFTLEMTQERRDGGKYTELFYGEKSCGYAISLSSVDYVKKASHLFSDAQTILFDEFMPESGKYLSKECDKLFAIHTAIARGRGQRRRYLPVILISNPVTLLNPYYLTLGISDRLQKNTHFLRGRGWVLEQGFNTAAANAQKASGIYKAFEKTKIAAYGNQGVYLSDSDSFINPIKNERARYIATFVVDGASFGVRSYEKSGMLYIDTSVDTTAPLRICAELADFSPNFVMINQYRYLFINWRNLFECGSVRFRNGRAKSAFLKLLSYL